MISRIDFPLQPTTSSILNSNNKFENESGQKVAGTPLNITDSSSEESNNYGISD